MSHVHDPLCPVATVYDAMGDRPAPSTLPPGGVLATLERIAVTNARFADCPEARAMPSMLGKQAEELVEIRAAVIEMTGALRIARLYVETPAESVKEEVIQLLDLAIARIGGAA